MPATITVTDEHPQFSAIAALLAGTAIPNAPTTSTTAPGAVSAPSPIAMTPAAPVQASTGDDGDEGPANYNAPDRDATGLPWDERIHAKTKATTGDGSWRKRRNVDDATVAAVEAELRGSVTTPVIAPMPIAPMMQQMPQIASAPQLAPPPVMQPMVAPTPQPMPTPMQSAVDAMSGGGQMASGTMDFAQFMQHLSGQMQKRDAAGAPLIHADYLASLTAEIAGAFGVNMSAITDIASNPQMITYASQLMQRDGRW